MIHLTPAAARQMHAALEESAGEVLGLRVAARLGADGAPEYGMGLDEPRQGDLELTEKGVPLLIGEASRQLLHNIRIDYVEYEPGDFRFLFIAQDACAAPGDEASQGNRRSKAGTCGSCGGCPSAS